jgi:hypothetical protein
VTRRIALPCLLPLAFLLAGCAGVLQSPPVPGPESFPGIASQLDRLGVEVLNPTSGDPGCDDPDLSPTSIRFEAQGLDQATPVLLRIYIFRNRAAWERRLVDVDNCAAEWAVDPATFEMLQVSPYVLAGEGPWPPEFDEAVRTAIRESAGNGG